MSTLARRVVLYHVIDINAEFNMELDLQAQSSMSCRCASDIFDVRLNFI